MGSAGDDEIERLAITGKVAFHQQLAMISPWWVTVCVVDGST
jgi:hypothetical protein